MRVEAILDRNTTHSVSDPSAARPAADPGSSPLDTSALGDSRHLVELVQSSLDDDKAENVVVIDLAGKSSIADYMVIASGRSTRQVSSMAEKLQQRLRDAGFGKVSMEGERAGDWVVIDAFDVVVHIFRPEVREFYNLEKMWSSSPRPAQAAHA